MTNDWLIKEIQNRLLVLNRNWLAIVCGDTGSGKSEFAISLGEMVDPNFSIDNIVFTTKEFMKIANPGTLPKGSCVVWDECGVGMPARAWMTLTNQLTGFILQTFRHQNLAVIFTTPSLDFIDIQARKLFHNYFEPKYIDRKKETVIAKMLDMQNNPQMGKIYMKYPVIDLDDGRGEFTLTEIEMERATKGLREKYEVKKEEFTKSLGKRILATVEDMDGTKEQKEQNEINEKVDKVLENIDKFINDKGKVDKYIIKSEFGVGRPMAEEIATLVRTRIMRDKNKPKKK